MPSMTAKPQTPEGSIIIETGGTKGKAREVQRNELHKALVNCFSISGDQIVSEYGMCELSAQAR